LALCKYYATMNKSEFITCDPYTNLDSDFLKGVIASLEYSSFKYKNKTLNLKNNYDLSNTILYYKK